MADEQKKEQEAEKTKATATREDRLAVAPGMTVRVHQRITDVTPEGKERERIQIFDGIVLAHHGGKTDGATITVRKISEGIGVEKIFPLYLPTIEKIEIVKRARVRRARLYFLRTNPKKLKEVKKKK
ncbi:50S ribosomal protein L19 [Candidatus Uhrbacteria bacterium]|nr:50S ribosomal protein L19 [Candidatus Uhrbacteria bacterium]